MNISIPSRRAFASWQIVAVLSILGGAAFAHSFNYITANLDSDIPGVAYQTDPLLVNPWGIVTGVEGNIHTSDDATGVSTLYDPKGNLIAFSGTFHSITIPFVTGTLGAPTGVADNQEALLSTSTDDFPITSGTVVGSSNFIYATEDGVIAGFNNQVDPSAAITGTSVAGAGFTGICISWSGTDSELSQLGHEAFVTDFANGQVDVFNNKWQQQVTGTAAFVDPNLPTPPLNEAWSPFNIHTLDFNGKVVDNPPSKNKIRHLLLVTYALHSTLADKLNDIPGSGNGYVAMFDTGGNFIKQLDFASDVLNSPWGISVAHHPMPGFSAPLVVFVANHGDGTIHAYGVVPHFPNLDAALGPVMKDDAGDLLTIDSLWGLRFASVKESIAAYIADQGADLKEDTNDWYFSAGIVGETHGLLGHIITPAH
ncbi:MAG: TIGR03118 family protein [Chthoniobacteraceae bacterium]